MRDHQNGLGSSDRPPDHLGLAYERWAPHGDDVGKIERFDRWLDRLERVSISRQYRLFYRRWRDSFGPDPVLACVELQGRMLIGHGNAGGNEVGLTVHHTWGVPVIPGSALKGLLAHRFDILYGPRGELPGPDESERALWRGVRWSGESIRHGPGKYYRALFGAPDAADDDELRDRGELAGASAGLVHFHDALYVPGSVEGDRPFARDVLTVHHKPYYDNSGEQWPNDWESPNPVSFLGVRAPARFLIVLTSRPGATSWAELARDELLGALAEWGIGGKTSLGYGRLLKREPEAEPRALDDRPPDASRPQISKRQLSRDFTKFEDLLKDKNLSNRDKFDLIIKDWGERLMSLDFDERRLAATRIEKMPGKKGLPAELTELVRKLREEQTVEIK